MPWMNNINEMRDAVQSILSQYVDVETVVSERFEPAFEHELPLVSHYFGEEAVEDDKTRPIIKRRTVELRVDIVRKVDQEEGLDAWLYERAFEVEQALDSNKYFGKEYIQDMYQTSVSPGDITLGADNQARVLRVVYNIIYITEIKPFGSLDEFLRFRSKYDTDQDQTRFEAEDHVTIREE